MVAPKLMVGATMSVPWPERMRFWTVSSELNAPVLARFTMPPPEKFKEPLPLLTVRSPDVALSCSVPPARIGEALLKGVSAPVV